MQKSSKRGKEVENVGDRKKERQNRKCKKANGGAMLKVLSTDNRALERATKDYKKSSERREAFRVIGII
jgi:hypothetical protein